MVEEEEEVDSSRVVAQEMFISQAAKMLIDLMKEKNVSRAELARRIGKSPSFITQALGGTRNMTLRTIADFAYALGCELKIERADTTELGGEMEAN